jgi:hypothetical protein
MHRLGALARFLNPDSPLLCLSLSVFCLSLLLLSFSLPPRLSSPLSLSPFPLSILFLFPHAPRLLSAITYRVVLASSASPECLPIGLVQPPIRPPFEAQQPRSFVIESRLRDLLSPRLFVHAGELPLFIHNSIIFSPLASIETRGSTVANGHHSCTRRSLKI